MLRGLEYMDYRPGNGPIWSHIHIFRFNPKYYRLTVALASQTKRPSATVKTLGTLNNALVTINGGFFTPAYRSLGLRISNGKQLSPLKAISWWGVFYLKHNRAYMRSMRQFKQRRVDFAVQGGPRLLVAGKIPKLKEGLDNRTALGITKGGSVIMLVTQNYPMSTTELAKMMRDVLHCRYALNLDGGGSSQLFVNIDDFKMHVAGYSQIADVIMLTARHNKR